MCSSCELLFVVLESLNDFLALDVSKRLGDLNVEAQVKVTLGVLAQGKQLNWNSFFLLGRSTLGHALAGNASNGLGRDQLVEAHSQISTIKSANLHWLQSEYILK